MAARKRRGNRKRAHPFGDSPAQAAGEPGVRPEPVVRREPGAAAPSALQKCLLAAAIVVQTAWLAALAMMALAE